MDTRSPIPVPRSPFSYEIPATRERVGELFDDHSPLEELPDGMERQDFIDGFMSADATYAVMIDGRLAGVAAVWDASEGRTMCFTKTSYLTSARRVTFARGIPQLLADLADAERRRGAAGPMYMHTPDGDDRSRAWFARAGCEETDCGLLCPDSERRD